MPFPILNQLVTPLVRASLNDEELVDVVAEHRQGNWGEFDADIKTWNNEVVQAWQQNGRESTDRAVSSLFTVGAHRILIVTRANLTTVCMYDEYVPLALQR